MTREPMVLDRRAREIHPPEAATIAASVAAAGQQVAEEAEELRAIRSMLEQSWNGNARELFLLDCERLPADGDSLASLVRDDHAARIAQITVIIWVAELVPLSQTWE